MQKKYIIRRRVYYIEKVEANKYNPQKKTMAETYNLNKSGRKKIVTFF